jgi:hypothetical protein
MRLVMSNRSLVKVLPWRWKAVGSWPIGYCVMVAGRLLWPKIGSALPLANSLGANSGRGGFPGYWIGQGWLIRPCGV